jgi:mannose-6-phosphate isomerase-like protein (cupin superfamily)
MKRYRAENPEYVKRQNAGLAKRNRLRLYGLTEDDFAQLLLKQGGVCPCCKMPFLVETGGRSRDWKPHVDHDHETGKIRGLLCAKCNVMIGMARNSQGILARAIDYLNANGANPVRRGWQGLTTGKVWGTTTAYLVTPLVEFHRITALPNSQCSLHKHEKKNNTFFVISGRLIIEVQKNDYALTDTTTLEAGGLMTVRPGEFHRFRTDGQGADALEIYHLDPLMEDIVRKDVGGRAQTSDATPSQ